MGTRDKIMKNKQIGSFVKDGKKLKRFVKACSEFFLCLSSQNYIAQLGSY